MLINWERRTPHTGQAPRFWQFLEAGSSGSVGFTYLPCWGRKRSRRSDIRSWQGPGRLGLVLWAIAHN
jgi:hypothetical protein